VKLSLSIRKKEKVRIGEEKTPFCLTVFLAQMDFSTEAVITEMKRDGARQTKATVSD